MINHEATTRELERLFERAEQGEFNSITRKSKVENQNQDHNVRNEAFGSGQLYNQR